MLLPILSFQVKCLSIQRDIHDTQAYHKKKSKPDYQPSARSKPINGRVIENYGKTSHHDDPTAYQSKNPDQLQSVSPNTERNW